VTQRKIPHRPTTQRLSREPLHLAKEIRSIQHRAAEHDGRIVTIGPLVLFSTETGDAWLLDPADQLATRLAYAGDPLPVYIEETDANYAIGWQGCYRIDGNTFVYTDNASRRITAIRGYPIQKVLLAFENLRRS
jgi:hypothetical protein